MTSFLISGLSWSLLTEPGGGFLTGTEGFSKTISGWLLEYCGTDGKPGGELAGADFTLLVAIFLQAAVGGVFGDLGKLAGEDWGLAVGEFPLDTFLDSSSEIFLPAMLWESKTDPLAWKWTVPLTTPSVMVWTVWWILPSIWNFCPPKENLEHWRSVILNPRSLTKLKSMREVLGTESFWLYSIEKGRPFMEKTNSLWSG